MTTVYSQTIQSFSASFENVYNFFSQRTRLIQLAAIIVAIAVLILAKKYLWPYLSNLWDLNSPRNIEARNKATFKKIEKLAKQGQSLCCFLCRTGIQSLPKEPNRVWISIDHAPLSQKLQDGRLHLQINLKDPKQVKRIQGLFDMVVLDCSSLKFFINSTPYRTFGLLLKDHEQSKLLMEARPGLIPILSDPKESSFISLKNGFFWVTEKDFSNYQTDKYKFWKAKMYPKLKNHLKTLFNEVLLLDGIYWPYPASYTMDHFFILRGPKINKLKNLES